MQRKNRSCVSPVPMICLALVAFPSAARAEMAGTTPVSRYVLIVANNGVATESGLTPLRYADDDGVQYKRLFERAATRVELLTVLDNDSQTLYPDEAAHTRPPSVNAVRATLALMLEDIALEKRNGRGPVELVFIYVGHGEVDNEGKGFVHLSDGVLTRANLFADLLTSQVPDAIHVIVDACHAGAFVAGRGTDGHDEPPVDAFVQFLGGHDLDALPNVGVLFAATADQTTHEWSKLRAGIFSHQVRAGLAGAADVNHDGKVAYSELAAFVEASNAGLRGVGKALKVLAWAPKRDRQAALIDLREYRDSGYLALAEGVTAHYYVEGSRGERVTEFHKPTGERLLVALPARETLYLRDGTYEATLTPGTTPVLVEKALAKPSPVDGRGAVDYAFEAGLFALPFSSSYYWGYVGARPEHVAVAVPKEEFWPCQGAATLEAESRARDAQVLQIEYRTSPALFRRRLWEQGLAVRLSRPLVSGWEVVGGVEASGAHLAEHPKIELARGAAFVGLARRFELSAAIAMAFAAEVGNGVVALFGPNDTADNSVPFVRVRGAFQWRWQNDLG